jgi:hypothetical protein
MDTFHDLEDFVLEGNDMLEDNFDSVNMGNINSGEDSDIEREAYSSEAGANNSNDSEALLTDNEFNIEQEILN